MRFYLGTILQLVTRGDVSCDFSKAVLNIADTRSSVFSLLGCKYSWDISSKDFVLNRTYCGCTSSPVKWCYQCIQLEIKGRLTSYFYSQCLFCRGVGIFSSAHVRAICN